jgi:HAD superfamily hydrolase (TIGR01509 family)
VSGLGFELVVFDNDGVLVDSERLANGVLAGLLTEWGLVTTVEESIERYMGGSMAGVRATVEGETGWRLPDDFEQRYHEQLFAGFRNGLQPVPGVREVLDELDRRGVRYCVASSGTHERIRLALSTVGLLDRFGDERIISAEDVVHGKPAPDLFLHAADRMVTKPGGCVVVEDSPAGVAAAQAAGMSVVGCAALTPAERLADADAAVTAMDDLVPALVRMGDKNV